MPSVNTTLTVIDTLGCTRGTVCYIAWVMKENRAALIMIVTLGLAASAPVSVRAEDISLGYGNFGGPGLIDMPTAFSRPDAELSFNAVAFQNTRRFALSFQLTPRLSTSFRYSQLYDINSRPDNPTPTFKEFVFDRSFGLHFRLLDETALRPAVAVGLNDFLGTGFFEGEYVVASKSFGPRVQATVGLGWGRLGTLNGFDNPLALLVPSWETRGRRTTSNTGGEVDTVEWFQGPAAIFAGVEWQATDRLRLVAEYSTDDYIYEDGLAFDQVAPVNLGMSYRLTPGLTLNAQYLYASEIAVGFNYAWNPQEPPGGSGFDSMPIPVLVRDDRAAGTWPSDPDEVSERLAAALSVQEIGLFGLQVAGDTAQVAVETDTHPVWSQVVGRTMRALTRTMPPEVDVFAVTMVENGIPVGEVTLARSDVEALEFDIDGAWLSYARAGIADATEAPVMPGLFPRSDWGLRPSLSYSLFDPDAPLRLGLWAELWAEYEPVPGVLLAGSVRQVLAGNLDDATRPSDSVLPRVRSESNIFDKATPSVPRLTAAWYFRPGENLFGRVTAGYLEPMFAGISGEVLWAPNDSRLAFGAELNHVVQRDFEMLFGLRDYDVTTGHASAYWDLASCYGFQIDAGRYLAGDWGATLTFDRTFDNGWRVAAFATQTDVPFEEFGEGSFDKGIIVEIPISWASGLPDQRVTPVTIRPVLRDGGARLFVDGRLYDIIRDAQGPALGDAWGRFWR
jgi:hypothetical protein